MEIVFDFWESIILYAVRTVSLVPNIILVHCSQDYKNNNNYRTSITIWLWFMADTAYVAINLLLCILYGSSLAVCRQCTKSNVNRYLRLFLRHEQYAWPDTTRTFQGSPVKKTDYAVTIPVKYICLHIDGRRCPIII